MRRVPTEMASSLPEIRECYGLIKINFIVETPRFIDVRLVKRPYNEIDSGLTARCGQAFYKYIFVVSFFIITDIDIWL